MAALSCYMKNKAFSLIEVMVSVTVLAIGIVAVLEALSFSVRATGLFSDIINAAFVFEDKMQELEFKEKNKMLAQEPGKIEDKAGKFEYKYTLVLDSDLNLYKLNFTIGWQRSNKKEQIELNTYLR